VLCGLSFLMLRMNWGGTVYAMMTLGIFGASSAVVNFLKRKNAMEHLPYIAIPMLCYQLMALFAHARGGLPYYQSMTPNETYPLVAAIGLSLILEYLRARMYGPIILDDGTLEGRVMDFAERRMKLIGLLTIATLLFSLVFYKTPADWMNFGLNQIRQASGVRSVVHQTVAEQNPMAESFSEYLTIGYREYGFALYLCLIMIPVLAYLVHKEGSLGALFLLAWTVPMMYGSYHKMSWAMPSSASITALGASVGLFVAVKRKDLFGLKAIATYLLFIVPLAYVPMFGPMMYSQAVGYMVMHMGPSADIYQWEPMLEWHANHTSQGDAILTWWDYGHWITAIAQRPVIADGLQDDYYEIQDVARFFMNKTDEEEAFNTVREYNKAYKAYNESWGLNYASIDWTMIGKGGALHFIATGVIENATPGVFKNYAQCEFMPQASELEDQLITGANSSLYHEKKIVFGCDNGLAITFDVAGDGVKDINVLTNGGPSVPWDVFSREEDASLLGVQPLWNINEKEKMPSILYCAMNWNDQRLRICRLPQFNTLVYVPQEFNDYMMTRLYLGKYMEEYKAAGLYNREVTPLRHFREIPDYNGDGMPEGEFSLGFVRSYEISYDGFNQTTT
jgi:hypothetical protein